LEFKPRILVFTCNWCSYAGADLAGMLRLSYPPTIRIVRVMCSGRVDPTLVIEAFKSGADGVLITGCHPGDCHYMKGNLYALRRFLLLRRLLADMGIDPRRLELRWISAGEGSKFAETVKWFTETIKSLGPARA